jgi:hypothetical protein
MTGAPEGPLSLAHEAYDGGAPAVQSATRNAAVTAVLIRRRPIHRLWFDPKRRSGT